MAVGTARILGVNLSKNFEPLILLSSSFRKFWRGWHITLTNWIRDYIYVPLTLKEKNVAAINLGPVYIFFFVGLWHGANWTYIIWGTLQGVFIVAERLLQPVRIFLEKSVGKVVIDAIGFILFFNAFTFANFFFRSASVSQALHTMKNIFVYPGTGLNPGLIPLEFYLLFSLLALAVVFEFSRRKHPPIDLINFRRGWVRWSTYLILGLAVWFLRIPEDIKFIYFDF
jgi:D-alanyl-lipoteichoic acid acyltransferase DltB (MBOAT superfamily)